MDPRHQSIRLVYGFSHASAIGFAIFDTELCYQTINSALDGMNGIPAERPSGSAGGQQ